MADRFDLDKFYTDPIDEFINDTFDQPTVTTGIGGVVAAIPEEYFNPDEPGMSDAEAQRLSKLTARKERLQPIDVGQLGSSRIPNNPYSIDTTQLMSGLGDLAGAIINKERRQRLAEIAPELSKLMAKKTAIEDKSENGPKMKKYRESQKFFEVGMKLIANGAIRAGINALKEGGLPTESILQALPHEQSTELQDALKQNGIDTKNRPSNSDQPPPAVKQPTKEAHAKVKGKEEGKEQPVKPQEEELNKFQELIKALKEKRPSFFFDSFEIQPWKNSGRV